MSFLPPHPKIPPISTVAGKNWAGNLIYSARYLTEPQSREELATALRNIQGPIKFLGSRHCFNNIADTDGTLISLARLEPLTLNGIEVAVSAQDQSRGTVKVPGAITYGALAQRLDSQGWALSNFASLPHISVAGSIATGTHGSGDTNPGLVGQIESLEIMTPTGQIRTAHRDGSGDIPFEAAVHLGALGAVISVELHVEAQYQMRQDLFTGLGWDQLWENFDAITSSAYSVSMFTRWYTDQVDQVWLKSRTTPDLKAAEGDTFFGAPRATTKLHPLPGVDPVHCTEQLGEPGPSHERLAHFKMGFTPSKGQELQSEYLVPRRHAVAAIQAVRALGDKIRPLLFVSEIRTIAADGAWLSPTGQEDSIGLHFTWHQQEVKVMRLLPQIEAALAPFEARPHWGKLHRFGREQLAPLYPHMNDFVALARECDPQGVLANRYLKDTLGL